jgi:hypothetical protein
MGQQWVNDFSLQLEKNIEFGKDDNVSIFLFFFFEIDKIDLSLTWSLAVCQHGSHYMVYG